MARLTVLASLVIMGLSLVLMGLLWGPAAAEELSAVATPAPIQFAEPLDAVTNATLQTTLETLLISAPDAFLPGTRVVPTRQMLPATFAAEEGWTLIIEGYPAGPLMDLSELRARLESANGAVRPLTLGSYFELEAPGIIAGRDLQRGTTLLAEDLAVAYLPLRGKQPGQVITDPYLVLGTALKSDLRAGQPVQLRLLTSPTLVHQGDTVTVRCVVGDLIIESSARALESGAQGERIALINPETGTRIEGEILSVGLVLVTP